MKMVSEKDYKSRMDGEVAPFLEKCRHSGYFDPDGVTERSCGGDSAFGSFDVCPKKGIYYEKYDVDKAAGVVVMVHGFSESAEKYAEMIYYFLQAAYRVYIMDVRGHGRSIRASEDLSLIHVGRYEDYLSDLDYLTEKIVKSENLGLPVYLYAHSMGGGIGAAFLERYPEVFQKAILSSPMIRALTGGIPIGVAKAVAAVQIAVGHGKRYVAGQHAFRGDETFEDSAATSCARYEYYYRKRREEALFQTSGASYSWLREAAKMSADVLKKGNCRRIRIPVLVFQAQKDAFVDGSAQETFAARAANVRLVMVEGAKHEIFMSTDDIMESYVGQILDFLG